MVSGANNIFKNPLITVGKPFIYKAGAAAQGTNYAQFDAKALPNYAQYDTYHSPVTKGVSGDRFDMMM